MATSSYMLGRKKYNRPQAMLWADNPGTLVNGLYVPTGYEVGGDTGSDQNVDLFNQFLILSDNNRAPISMTPTRIEKRERMINGRMRSTHIADKLTISTSWNLLPSRAYYTDPAFGLETGKSTMHNSRLMEHTTDGGAGGVELLDWYEKHKGSFWVYLAYDKYSNFGKDDNAYGHLSQYNQIVEMFFSDFSYSIEKRGSTNFDLWNISVSLEEV